MALTTTYMQTCKNLDGILQAIRKAGVPPKFTNEFLKGLGFTSSNDRSVIGVLKGLEFLDSNGVPTSAYHELRDESKWKKVLGRQMKKAYEDLFLSDTTAHSASVEKVKGFFATKTGKDRSVVDKMATTFKSLAKLADFTSLEERQRTGAEEPSDEEVTFHEPKPRKEGVLPQYHYNIQVHLPVTKDISVYNAIFKSLREHLL